MQDSLFSKIFKGSNDHKLWEKQIEYANQMDRIDKTMKSKYASAILFLEKELGRSFLSAKNKNQKSHPLTQKVFNKASWQIIELIQFSETLKILKDSDCNYQRLKSKLLSFTDSINEGVHFIDIAKSYLNSNFKLNFLNEDPSIKTPDIKIENPINQDTFYIEVSKLNENQQLNSHTSNYHFLSYWFQDVAPVYPCTVIQKMPFLDSDYPEIINIIIKTKNHIKNKGELVTVSSDPRFEFTIAPIGKFDELKFICDKIGTRPNEIRGLPLNFDETKRLISKINDKVKQIPKAANGMIYIPIHFFSFLALFKSGSLVTIYDAITKFPNLLGVVLYTTYKLEQEARYEESERHCYSLKVTGNSLCHELFFVFNHRCTLEIKEETLDKIYGAFRN